ncbi:potassium channel family protein [Natronomonas sp. EA1]|uniref:potassium channel family protein n=1 Tax=Natronomonas sp. EA1 TaxID=3421655 RepID=UPI003EB6A6BD
MSFIIVGYGRVGRRTAHILQSEGHEVVIVEHDPERVEWARRDGFDAIEGDGEDERVLLDAGLEDAQAVGGLTGDLNVNFAACVIANGFGCRTVMRIDEDYRQEIYERYAADVDEIVYPERLGAAGAKTALLGGDLNVLADLTQEFTVATLDVHPGSPLIGKRVVEVELPGDARIYAHGHDKEPMEIPLPKTVIEAGDNLAVLAPHDAIGTVQEAVRGGAA